MKQLPNFSITASSPVSNWFREKGIQDLYAAIQYLKEKPCPQAGLPCYLTQVIGEERSASAKTAFLSVLALENQRSDIKLTLCTYADNFPNNPLVKCVLQKHGLPALPEVACYLKFQGRFYAPISGDSEKNHTIISDIEISYQQIGSFMKRYHRHFVNHWLQLEKLHHSWTFESISEVKQECLKAIESEPWLTNRPPYEA